MDDAETFDSGKPAELGMLVGDLFKKFPHLSITGGCCGTDMRHMKSIVKQAKLATV